MKMQEKRNHLYGECDSDYDQIHPFYASDFMENIDSVIIDHHGPKVWRYILSGNYSYLYREGNGAPLQYSWLENPMDGGAW